MIALLWFLLGVVAYFYLLPVIGLYVGARLTRVGLRRLDRPVPGLAVAVRGIFLCLAIGVPLLHYVSSAPLLPLVPGYPSGSLETLTTAALGHATLLGTLALANIAAARRGLGPQFRRRDGTMPSGRRRRIWPAHLLLSFGSALVLSLRLSTVPVPDWSFLLAVLLPSTGWLALCHPWLWLTSRANRRRANERDRIER